MRMLALSLLSFSLHLSQALRVPPQEPLRPSDGSAELGDLRKDGRKLKGKFLHITDLHPDPFYTVYSSTDVSEACHRGTGPAGYFGAETTDCDSPFSLVNATFDWIEKNLKGNIDFVIWTGDSARHDNDESHPRDEKQVLDLNSMLVEKFNEVFGKDKNHDNPDPTDEFLIPIVPSLGNNDVLPHNILTKGPNKWTEKYAQIWRQFIPEEQRHGFNRGGWFYVEVIPNQLAVFSLNTMYFFDKNSAVDGCASKKEPGYEHMEWLRIQLEFIRQRGMKAIMTGHVPPARTEEKDSWDETCWQKYALWMQQYRDVVVGSIYGHMNIDHFILQDFKDIDVFVADGSKKPKRKYRTAGDDVSAQSEPEYLIDLRNEWSKIPDPPSSLANEMKTKIKKSKEKRFQEKIGGAWAERYAVSHVSASVVPNYFPTLRVFEYNISGIKGTDLLNRFIPSLNPITHNHSRIFSNKNSTTKPITSPRDSSGAVNSRKRKKKKKKPKKPNFHVPKPPSKSSPPGPAYSPQTLSWLGYTQYYANITYINHDFDRTSLWSVSSFLSLLDPTDHLIGDRREQALRRAHSDERIEKWKPGKHPNKKPHKYHKPQPRNFTFGVEFDTRDDNDAFGFNNDTGLYVRGYVELAARIGKFDPRKANLDIAMRAWGNHDIESSLKRPCGDVTMIKKSKRRREINRAWFTFVKRAFVSAIEEDDLKDMFGEEQELHARSKNEGSSHILMDLR